MFCFSILQNDHSKAQKFNINNNKIRDEKPVPESEGGENWLSRTWVWV